MTPPKSVIFINGKKVIDKIKGSQNRVFIVLENDEKIQLKNVKKIQIQCNECENFSTISLYHKIYEKLYFCLSCNQKGEKNSFYGKKHSNEMKEKLSKERTGTWYTGENNSMYGRSPKDYLTPEQLEIKREKNKQDTLNRDYNPFKYSMREIIGDERYEESLKKRKETIKNYTQEQKNIISQRLSDSQKRLMKEDPEAYKAKGAED